MPLLCTVSTAGGGLRAGAFFCPGGHPAGALRSRRAACSLCALLRQVDLQGVTAVRRQAAPHGPHGTASLRCLSKRAQRPAVPFARTMITQSTTVGFKRKTARGTPPPGWGEGAETGQAAFPPRLAGCALVISQISSSCSISANSSGVPWTFGPLNHLRAEIAHQMPAKPMTASTATGV